jgi:hypothetical protein
MPWPRQIGRGSAWCASAKGLDRSLPAAAEPLTFRNDGLGVFQEVYDYNDSGAKVGVRPKLKKELATFLEQWLKNISDQGYDVKAAEERE